MAGTYLSWQLWSARYLCQRWERQRGCSLSHLRPLRLATDVPGAESEWMVWDNTCQVTQIIYILEAKELDRHMGSVFLSSSFCAQFEPILTDFLTSFYYTVRHQRLNYQASVYYSKQSVTQKPCMKLVIFCEIFGHLLGWTRVLPRALWADAGAAARGAVPGGAACAVRHPSAGSSSVPNVENQPNIGVSPWMLPAPCCLISLYFSSLITSL